MYEILLFFHAWLRWILLGLLVIALYRSFRFRSSTEWSNTDVRIIRWIALIATFQLALGVLLYAFFSAPVSHAFANPGLAMRTTSLRFWFLEHPVLMLIMVALAHFQRMKVQRQEQVEQKRKTVLLWSGIMIILILAGSPFPWSSVPRPLFYIP